MTLEDIYRLLRTGHVQTQVIVDTLDLPLLVLDESLCVENANPAFLAAFRVSRDDTLGTKFSHLGNGQWNIPDLLYLLEQVIPKAAAVVGYEVTHDFPGIGKRTMLVTARRLVHPDNNSIFMLVVFEDVTQQRREDTARDLIAREVEHRLKNFLTLVVALAHQVPAEGAGAQAYRDGLISRLEAMTRSELGLFAPGGDDLAVLATAALAPYGQRIRLGRAQLVKLDRGQAQAFGMVFHELATNAVKFGSLSVPAGTVRIGWEVTGEGDDRHLSFEWQEQGGPAAREPKRAGFGSRLLTSLVTGDLGGTLDRHFGKDGLHVKIDCPLKQA